MMMKRLKVKQMVALLLCACCIIALIPALPARAVKCAKLPVDGSTDATVTAVESMTDIPTTHQGLIFEYTMFKVENDVPVPTENAGEAVGVMMNVYGQNVNIGAFSMQIKYNTSLLEICNGIGDVPTDPTSPIDVGSSVEYPLIGGLGVLKDADDGTPLSSATFEGTYTGGPMPLEEWYSEPGFNEAMFGSDAIGIWSLDGVQVDADAGKLDLEWGILQRVIDGSSADAKFYDLKRDGLGVHFDAINGQMPLCTVYFKPTGGLAMSEIEIKQGDIALFAADSSKKSQGGYIAPGTLGDLILEEEYIKDSFFVGFPGITYNEELPNEEDPEKKMTIVSTITGSNEYVEIGLNINGRSAKAEDFQNAGALLSYDNTMLTPVDWNGNTLDLPTVDSMAAAWAGGKLLPTKNADQMNSQLAAVFSITGGKSYLYLSAGAAKPLTGYQQSLPTGEALTGLPAATTSGKAIAGVDGAGGTLGAGQAVVARFKVNGSYTAADLAGAVDLVDASTGLADFPVDLGGSGAVYDDGKGSGAAALADVDFFWIANGASASTGGSSGGETGERTYSLLFNLLGGQVYLRPDGATSGGTDVTTSLFQAINGKSANTAVNLPTYTGDMTGQKLVFVNSGKEYESLTFVGTDGKQYTFNSNNTWTGANGNSVTIPDHDMSLLALWPNGSISGGGSGETGDRTYSLLFNLLGGEVYVRDGGTDQPVGSTLFADRTGIAGNTNAALPTQTGLTAGQTLVFKNGGQEYTELTFAGTNGNKYTLKSDNTWTDASGNPVSTVAMAEHDMALLALWPNGSISGSTGHRLMFNLMSGSVLVRDAGATVGGTPVTDTLFVEQTITTVGAAVTLPTQADLNGGSLVFVHGGKEYDSLTFIGTDGNTYILKSDNTWTNGDGTAITSLTMPGNDVCLLALWPNGGIGGAASSHRLMFNLLTGEVLVRDASATEGGTSVGGSLFAEIAGLNTGDTANLPTQADMTDKTLVFKNGDQEYESLTFVGTDGKQYTLNKDNTWTGANGSSLTMPDHDMALLALWPNGTIGGGSSGGGGEGSATHKLMFNLLGTDGDVVVRPNGATDNTGDVSVKADLFAGLSDLNTGDAATLPTCPDGKLNGGNLVFTKGGKEYKSLTFIGTNGEQYTLKTDNTWAGADGAPVATVTMPDNDVCLLALWPNGAVSGSAYRLLLSMMNGKAVARTNTTPDAAPGEEVWTERDVTAELEQLFADLDGVKEGEDITLPTVTLNEGEQLAFRNGDQVYSSMSFIGTDKSAYTYNGNSNSWTNAGGDAVTAITMPASHVALAARWPDSPAGFASIVFYDWDETILGSVIVPKGDAAAQVLAFQKARIADLETEIKKNLDGSDDADGTKYLWYSNTKIAADEATLADDDPSNDRIPKYLSNKKGYDFDTWLLQSSDTFTAQDSALPAYDGTNDADAKAKGVANFSNVQEDMTVKASYKANETLNKLDNGKTSPQYTMSNPVYNRLGAAASDKLGTYTVKITVKRENANGYGVTRLQEPLLRVNVTPDSSTANGILYNKFTLGVKDEIEYEFTVPKTGRQAAYTIVDAYGMTNLTNATAKSATKTIKKNSGSATADKIGTDGFVKEGTIAFINEQCIIFLKEGKNTGWTVQTNNQAFKDAGLTEPLGSTITATVATSNRTKIQTAIQNNGMKPLSYEELRSVLGLS